MTNDPYDLTEYTSWEKTFFFFPRKTISGKMIWGTGYRRIRSDYCSAPFSSTVLKNLGVLHRLPAKVTKEFGNLFDILGAS